MKIPLYGISSLLIMITSLGIALFVFAKGAKSRINRIWIIFTLCVAVYGLGAYRVSFSQNAESALFWWQVAYIGIILIPVLFMHFVYSILDIKRTFTFKALYFATFILLILNIFKRELFLGDLDNVTLFFVGSKVFKPGYWIYPSKPLLIFYIIFLFVGVIVWSHIQLIRGYKRATSLQRYQIKYFFLGTTVGFFGGATSFFPCFNISLYPVLNIGVVLYPIITAYAIIKYRLMDITVAVTRTGVFITVYTLVLGLPFVLATASRTWLINLLGPNWWIGPLVLMALLATAGPYLYIFFQRRAENLLLYEQREYQRTLKKTAVEITRIPNLQKLLDLIVNIFIDTVKISHFALYRCDRKSESFSIKAGCFLKEAQASSISKKNSLIIWLQNYKEPMVYEEIRRKAQEIPHSTFKELEKEMYDLNAAVVVPSVSEDRLSCILLLGEKKSGKMYTSEDLNIFSVLASQMALAIDNALLYENMEEQVKQRTKELVQLQKQLIQAEKLATVGTLAGGVAHEINNPLTAILTNAEMLLVSDTIQDESDKESLELIKEATKRCRSIVKKLMVYARKPLEAGELSKVNLIDVINNVFSFLSYQLKQENIIIDISAKDEEYLVMAKPNELEQVVTNMILNAKDAIKRVKKSGTIYLSFLKRNDCIGFKIKDEGMGMPEEIKSKVFDPFFTTKDVGKGLGLGLSICQAIAERHGGSITVESEPNKGSVFTVELPKAGME